MKNSQKANWKHGWYSARELHVRAQLKPFIRNFYEAKMRMRAIAVLLLFSAITCACKQESLPPKVEITPLVGIEIPSNLALSKTCIDLWERISEDFLYPARQPNWNQDLSSGIYDLLQEGCVHEKTAEVDYNSIDDLMTPIYKNKVKIWERLLEWRKKNPAPSSVLDRTKNLVLILFLPEETACRYYYNNESCLEFYSLKGSLWPLERYRHGGWIVKKDMALIPGVFEDEMIYQMGLDFAAIGLGSRL